MSNINFLLKTASNLFAIFVLFIPNYCFAETAGNFHYHDKVLHHHSFPEEGINHRHNNSAKGIWFYDDKGFQKRMRSFIRNKKKSEWGLKKQQEDREREKKIGPGHLHGKLYHKHILPKGFGYLHRHDNGEIGIDPNKTRGHFWLLEESESYKKSEDYKESLEHAREYTQHHTESLYPHLKEKREKEIEDNYLAERKRQLRNNQYKCMNKELSLIDLYKHSKISHVSVKEKEPLKLSLIFPKEKSFSPPIDMSYIIYLNAIFELNVCVVLYDDKSFGFFEYPIFATNFSKKGYDGTIFIGRSLLLSPKVIKPMHLLYKGEKSHEFDFIPLMVAHEYAHIFLNKKNIDNIINQRGLHPRTEELLCDFMAGFYFGKHQGIEWRPPIFGGKIPEGYYSSARIFPEFSKGLLYFWQDNINLKEHGFNKYGTPVMRYSALEKGGGFGGMLYTELKTDIAESNTIEDAYIEGLKQVSKNNFQFKIEFTISGLNSDQGQIHDQKTRSKCRFTNRSAHKIGAHRRRNDAI